MAYIYNPITKNLGSTDDSNWYVNLKSDISDYYNKKESVFSELANIFNDVNSTVNDIKTVIDSSGISESIISVSNSIEDLQSNINNLINSTTLSSKDKTALIKLQSAINNGTLLKSLPVGANINDYQMVTINNNVFYIKKNKTKQYIIYAIILISAIILVATIYGGKK